jgi:RimJ/RimL family protein N-acetyltransferase
MGFLEIVDAPGHSGRPVGTEGVIGYIVEPHATGQGIGTATARALLHAAFDKLGLRRVTAAANADNIASVRVLERAGMRRERHALKALWHQELGWLDEVEYALLDEEWATRTRRIVNGSGPSRPRTSTISDGSRNTAVRRRERRP